MIRLLMFERVTSDKLFLLSYRDSIYLITLHIFFITNILTKSNLCGVNQAAFLLILSSFFSFLHVPNTIVQITQSNIRVLCLL